MVVAEQAKITVRDNGPYLVKCPVLLLDAEGNEFRTERATGFRAAQREVREEVREGA
jgi:hypothetical protein